MTPTPEQHRPEQHRPEPAPAGTAPAAPAVPTATYRLQLQPDFPLSAAEAAVPRLAALGVSHLHLSPVLQACPGSTHGYDVVDHTRIGEEIGGEDALRSLARTARAHGMGLVVDIVPNHMAVPVPEHLSEPLWEVLRDGPGSRFADWFDIDWAVQEGRLLLPVLGGRLGPELGALETGTATVRGREERVLRYHDHVFPLRPGTEDLPLPGLLEHQWYRLAWWRLARTELNHRRFFTISDLIGVRVEDEAVFAATHGKLLELVRDGVVDGLRVDHPDGLADPRGYLRRLHAATGGRWTVVEKILGPGEPLPADWPCAGTTGYDALKHVDGLFVDPAGAARLAEVWTDFARLPATLGGNWAATVARATGEVVTEDLATEVARLVRAADRVCSKDPQLADHAPWALRTAVRGLLAGIPVYRPYVVPGEPAPERDAALLEAAAGPARAAFAVPEEAHAVDVVRDLALGRLGRGPDHDDFAVRFAQVSSALRAKAVEDTAFYRWHPLLGVNEVGGDPARPGTSPEDFHAFAARIQRDWPATATVLSTHDTKRSADVRARLAVLSEVPELWREWLEKESAADGRGRPAAPDRQVEYLVRQTAVGLGHCEAERLVPAVLKSVREARLRTGWTTPDPDYEAAVEAFVRGLCEDEEQVAALASFTAVLEPYAHANSLGAALVHLTMPGVPDLYQGSERELLTLVDPDNRRPVDFPRPFDADGFERSLSLGRGPTGNLSDRKLRLTATALRLRREHPEWFGAGGGYAPLHARGPAAEHLLAFLRGGGDGGDGTGGGNGTAGGAITAVVRLSRDLAQSGGWHDTVLDLPGGPWTDLITGAVHPAGPNRASALFAGGPAVLLVPTPR
ncbi:malto-oligosyltrehalose synthase [Streptomyces sp. SCUT-3]|uniref:malto-oligosyltrehalose synthase n=1 Tax=Streptomyces sp. SCUT-3 TaxID=2684469 RepID=UPI0015F90002|nr:malto-oligosyltrehalose synthase [Streptomyces sp. SCUT-3]QMV21348.1 malto-oligosyltrehalose synthase [Streptomyces sp. SCUT-3]